MKDLSRHIEYLLCDHNSVAIPGIGTFVIEELPARYYAEECCYLPPVRSVRLYTDKKADDGLLENCLIQLHRVTHNVAQKWIADFIDNINHQLLDNGYMDMGTIGRLVCIDNNICFEVCEAGVNAPDFYGLDSFHMAKLPAYAHKAHTQKDSTHFTIRLRRSTVHRVMTVAAMLIVVFTVILPNYRAFNISSKLQAQFASAESLFTLLSVNTTPKKATETDSTLSYIQTPATIINENQIDNALNDSCARNTLALLETAEQITEEVAITQSSSEENASDITQSPIVTEQKVKNNQLEVKGYCVVMASAVTNRGADHLITKLNKEGFHNAVKYRDNGMLRVLLIGYPNEESARATIAIVKEVDQLYSGTWLKHF